MKGLSKLCVCLAAFLVFGYPIKNSVGCSLDTEGKRNYACSYPTKIDVIAGSGGNAYKLEGECDEFYSQASVARTNPKYEVQLIHNCKSGETAETFRLSSYVWAAKLVDHPNMPLVYLNFDKYEMISKFRCSSDPMLNPVACTKIAVTDSVTPHLEPWAGKISGYFHARSSSAPLSVTVLKSHPNWVDYYHKFLDEITAGVRSNPPKPTILSPLADSHRKKPTVIVSAKVDLPFCIDGYDNPESFQYYKMHFFFELAETSGNEAVQIVHKWVPKQTVIADINYNLGLAMKAVDLAPGTWRVSAKYRLTKPGIIKDLSAKCDPVRFFIEP